jgi:hypothetical protein
MRRRVREESDAQKVFDTVIVVELATVSGNVDVCAEKRRRLSEG